MTMPYTCDALLPEAARAASPKFQRVAWRFHANQLDWGDACELVAFLHAVPIVNARWIFGWAQLGLAEANRLMLHRPLVDDAQSMVQRNLEEQDEGDGFAILAGMQRGGWKAGGVPPLVRMALLSLRDEGLSYAKVGDRVGITREQVRTITNGHRVAPKRHSSLLVG